MLEPEGTLAPNVLMLATLEVDYQADWAIVASGEFTVTGDEQFDHVTQNWEGVVCLR